MNIQVIRDPAQWATISSGWNALLNESHANLPFLTYEFQRAWWESLGGGEWQDAKLHILLGRSTDGRLLGIAPLFRVKDPQGKWALHFIGTHEIADFLDLIVRPADHANFVRALVDHLRSNPDADWHRIELYNLLDRSATQTELKAASQTAGLQFSQTTLQPSPYLVVPASLTAYLEGLDSKQAHEIRRKMRRAARNPEPISLEIIQDPAHLDAALSDFFRLMDQEANKSGFLKPEMRIQMERIAKAMFAAGWLQMVFLKAGQARIAGYMNFDYDNRIWAYNAGFDASYSSLSPGWLIMVEMVNWCIANGREAFDFMRGGEDYKYRFGAIDRFVEKIVIERK